MQGSLFGGPFIWVVRLHHFTQIQESSEAGEEHSAKECVVKVRGLECS